MGRWLEIPETANIVMQDATKGISNVCIKVYQCVLEIHYSIITRK